MRLRVTALCVLAGLLVCSCSKQRKVNTLNTRGHAHLHAYNIGLAEADFNAVLEIDSTNAMAHLGVGHVHMVFFDCWEAIVSYNKFLYYDGLDALSDTLQIEFYEARYRAFRALGDFRKANSALLAASSLRRDLARPPELSTK